MNKKFTGKPGYFTFTLVGIMILLTGIVMHIFGRTSSIDIGLKYGPAENSSITGDLVILLGIIMLGAILVFYLVERKRKA